MMTRSLVAAVILSVGTSVCVPSRVEAKPFLCTKMKNAVVRNTRCKKKEKTTLDFADVIPLVDGEVVRILGPATLSTGQTQELLRAGPFTLTARCRINAGGNDIADIIIGTDINGAVFDGDDKVLDLTMATEERNRQYGEVSAPTGEPSFDGLEGTARAPDGTSLSSVHYVGVNVANAPGQCIFGGHAFVSGLP